MAAELIFGNQSRLDRAALPDKKLALPAAAKFVSFFFMPHAKEMAEGPETFRVSGVRAPTCSLWLAACVTKLEPGSVLQGQKTQIFAPVRDSSGESRDTMTDQRGGA